MRQGARLPENAAWLFLCACPIWLAFPSDFISVPPLVLLWPFSLCMLGRSCKRGGQAFLYGWLGTASGMIAALYWLAMPLAQVGGLAWPLAFLCALLIAFLLACQGGLFCALANGLKNRPVWTETVALCLGWYLLEYGFARYVGFPWLPLAGAFAQWPILIQAADIFGAYFLGSVWLFCFLVFCNSFRPRLEAMSRILWGLSGLTLASCLLWYGVYRLAGTSEAGAGAVDCVMIQANVDQNQKWTPPFQRESLERYLRLTASGLAQARAIGMDAPLIIWPETAMPFFYEQNQYLAERIRIAVRTWGCPLVFGAPGQGDTQDVVFNRAFLLGPAGQTLGSYDKVHLVPFGESLPGWLKFEFLRNLLQGVGVYEAGTSIKSLDYGELALGLLICYEGIFPWLAEDRVSGGANILVDISNDGWFGNSPAARQHLYLTVLRCVEQGRWLLRATNTGITAVADDRGRIMQSGAMFREEYLICRALLESGRSIFYHAGSWLPWLALVAFGCIGCQNEIRKVFNQAK